MFEILSILTLPWVHERSHKKYFDPIRSAVKTLQIYRDKDLKGLGIDVNFIIIRRQPSI
jgi:hypothetical protein